ncbi:MAG TPA: TcpE family conjugal transfer membrane protein, partial [Streptosporangiaceae bacterium]
MDLPTYTSIWRIEKRLYKLYDFRLPMPLPIGQITVFTAIAVPYVVLLQVLGLPFTHTLIWLYILPPGVLTWLATRPVLESKRLPELIRSQLRYLAEPRVWCRMAPPAERDVIVVTGRVWRPSRGGGRRNQAVPAGLPPATRTPSGRPPGRPATPPAAWVPGPAPGRPAGQPGRRASGPAHGPASSPGAAPVRPSAAPARRTGAPVPARPLRAELRGQAGDDHVRLAAASAAASLPTPEPVAVPVPVPVAAPVPVPVSVAGSGSAPVAPDPVIDAEPVAGAE